ncbi:signal peptide peptidase SppA [Treponema sp.]|uniref:signal peptide peptidase SppA n=1 Tax=Treponema sp. TaxID=166 RepID=UPI0038903B4F
MKNNKGLKILITLALVALFFGGRKLLSTQKTDIADFETNFSFINDFDEDSFDEENSDSFTKILSKSISKNNESSQKNTKSPYISVIYISGVISEENKTYNQKWLLKKIKNAKNDSNNRGILLNINSPGGTVYESDEAYLALLDYKKTTNRPVFAYFASLAASGGYYIGCSADQIFANRNTLTGSIGVIAGQSLDATGLMEKIGIKMTTITAGKNKNMGNYNSVLTEEQRTIMQSIADEAYEQFTSIVADSRKMNISDVKILADGRIYTANQAKNNGLIDEVCSFDAAKNTISNSFEEEINFVDYKYHYEENWMSLLSGAANFAKNPEAGLYDFLGKTSAKCLYLYQ